MTKNEPLAHILDAAEALFSEHGFAGTSIRDVTRHAQINLAAIHYHFGDKRSLYCEVILRRLRPINRLRVQKLEAKAIQMGAQPVPLAVIFDIFARPVFALTENPASGGFASLRLLGRSMLEPLPFLDPVLTAELQPTMARFSQAIRRHTPRLSPEEFMWRLNFIIGALHHTLGTMHRMKELTRGLCKDHDGAGALRHFTAFAVNTLSAPAIPDYSELCRKHF